MRFKLRGARLVDASTDLAAGDILIADDTLAAVAASMPGADHDGDPEMTTIPVDDMIVTPGYPSRTCRNSGCRRRG